MIAPGAVVGDVHAPLALAAGCHQRAVQVDRGQVEEGVGLLSPEALPHGVEDVLQGVDVGRREAAAEVAGRGRVGDTAGAQRVEEHLVVAAQLDVLQTGALAQGVGGEVEDVVRLVKRQMDLEQVQALVDGVDQADLPGQGVDGADAAVGDAAAAVGDLVMDVGRRELRPVAIPELGLVQAAVDAALAVGEFAV